MIKKTTNGIFKKNVLVTGACGFIGKNLVNELLSQGANVTALDLKSADWSMLPKNVTALKIDLLDPDSLSKNIGDYSIIYHLAAKTDLVGKDKTAYKVNFEGTKNLILCVKNIDKFERFVFYSTQLVVGLFNEKRYINESEPYRTKTYYGESKIEAEKIVIKYCKKTNIRYTIIRPTSVYGPWGETPYREFFGAIKNRRYPHIGKGDNLVSWVYVKNLINLTILASQSKKAVNEIYFGNDLRPYTMKQIVDTVGEYYKIKIPTIPTIIVYPLAYLFGLLKIIGLHVPIYPSRLNNIRATYCYDIQKSLDIGYKPIYNLSQGIKETLDWYEEKRLI